MFMLGTRPVTLFEVMITLGATVTGCLCIIIFQSLRAGRARQEAMVRDAERAAQFEARLADLMKTNAEISGRLQTVAEVSVVRQSELTRSMNDRLDKMSDRLGHNMTATTKQTSDSLSKLHERLAVIDTAQKNLTDLSSQVVSLQSILSNKQSRGAFGQGRMEHIIKDGLPSNAFAFQATLSNNMRPDCVIDLPNTTGQIVIDAKFPLEGFTAFQDADTAETQKLAAARLRQDVQKHIKDISERYIIPGETQDTAIMFVPSEAIYADLHESFDDLIQKAYRARVIIVSPSMLMLAIQVMQAILKDAHMREQAHVIQKEVVTLMEDVHRLRERTVALQRHFDQAGRDVEQIMTSSDKIAKRGNKIGQLEFPDQEMAGDTDQPADVSAPRQPSLLAGE